jgi:hypothetical protein
MDSFGALIADVAAVSNALEDLPITHRRMAADVPSCPVCFRDGAAIRERVLRGGVIIDFWCCPPCGARWRQRLDDPETMNVTGVRVSSRRCRNEPRPTRAPRNRRRSFIRFGGKSAVPPCTALCRWSAAIAGWRPATASKSRGHRRMRAGTAPRQRAQTSTGTTKSSLALCDVRRSLCSQR